MGTETMETKGDKGKSIVELIKERTEMVAKGSCEECLYCEELPVAKIVGGDSCTHVCVMEAAGVWDEPLSGGEFITARSLEEEHYPTCHITLDLDSDVPRCFAFMPRDGVEAPEPTSHHWYMKGFVRAAIRHEIERTKVLEVKIAPRTVAVNSYWGLCPRCWAEGVVKDVEWANIYKAHFCYCGKHKVYWRIGENLFSSWRYETQELWDKNRAMLEQCQEVSPLHTKPFAYSITLDYSNEREVNRCKG